jgi:phage tail sheath gpL-like
VRAFRTRITGKYARAALTDRDTGIEGFVSPEQLRDELIAEYGFQESQGLVENTEIFAQALVVERNATEPDRVDAMARADLVNELGIFALLVESNLSSNTIKQTA